MASQGPPTVRPDAIVRHLIRPFDPTSAKAEDEYDAVVRRVNRMRATRARLDRELRQLEDQFVEDVPTIASGPRRGQPLSIGGRRRRLARLIELGIERSRVEAEERFATLRLDEMNQSLDRWARETYGV